jgi:flagellar assembly protein FliH
MTSSRLIRGQDAASWQAPAVSQRTGARKAAPDASEASWQEGFEAGRAAGLEAGAREIAARSAAIEGALDALARPLEDGQHRVEEELLALVQAVVRQLVRREVTLDPTHVVGIIREGLAALPLNSDNITVRLNPADAEVVRGCINGTAAERPWRLESDPLMERGGCFITTSRSVVDARLDARLARVMATLLGDERVDAS